MSSAAPHLSVVVTTRNDDHGGDPLRRLQAFVNTFDAQCRNARLDAELIVVEWNPPGDRPRLRELLRCPADLAFTLRFVEVPADLHARLRYADVLPLFQMIAKNVGIRRARGRFVLATNMDIIFSNELVDELASGRLEPGRLYRVERHDIDAAFPIDETLERKMEYCRSHQIRVHRQDGTHPVTRTGVVQCQDPDITACGGFTFGDGWHIREGDAEYGFYRWVMEDADFWLELDAVASPAPIVLDVEIEPNPYQPGAWVELEILADGQSLARRRVGERVTIRIPIESISGRRHFTLHVVDSSGGRDALPVFDIRPRLCYRVRRIGVATVPGHAYDAALWERVGDSAALTLERTPQGIEITTDPGRYSYCARYHPFEVPADGSYEFLLEYATFDGSFAFQIMDDERQTFLAARAVAIEDDGTRLLALTADLRRGMNVSLVVSNYRPWGGASRFVIRRLTASVPFERLRRRRSWWEAIKSARAWSRLGNAIKLPFRLLRKAASSVERGRAQRFEDIITDESRRVHDLEARVAALAPLADLASLDALMRKYRPSDLHQNASGDFQLMAREHWFALHGYAEFETFSMSLDGLMEATAVAAGLVEHVFQMPRCIYHLEHEKGSGWTPEGEALLRKRVAESGITWLETQAVHTWTSYMLWLRRPMMFNGANWGMSDIVLPETIFQPGLSGVIEDV
jgi:hypothetical protein